MFTDDSYAIFRSRHAVGRKKVDTDVLFSRASEVEFFGRHFVCTGFCMHGVFSASPKKTRAGPTS